MKELEIKPRADIHITAEQERQYKLVGHIILKAGLRLYEYNYKTGVLKETAIKREDSAVDIYGNTVKNGQATHNPDSIYFQALNAKNAEKKLKKILKIS